MEKQPTTKELAEMTMNERLYQMNLRHIIRQAGDDFLRYNLRLKWQMAAWAQGESQAGVR